MCQEGTDEDALAETSVSAASRNRNKSQNECIAQWFWRFTSVASTSFQLVYDNCDFITKFV